MSEQEARRVREWLGEEASGESGLPPGVHFSALARSWAHLDPLERREGAERALRALGEGAERKERLAALDFLTRVGEAGVPEAGPVLLVAFRGSQDREEATLTAAALGAFPSLSSGSLKALGEVYGRYLTHEMYHDRAARRLAETALLGITRLLPGAGRAEEEEFLAVFWRRRDLLWESWELEAVGGVAGLYRDARFRTQMEWGVRNQGVDPRTPCRYLGAPAVMRIVEEAVRKRLLLPWLGLLEVLVERGDVRLAPAQVSWLLAHPDARVREQAMCVFPRLLEEGAENPYLSAARTG